MPLSRNKVQDMWASGFCAQAVRYSAGTEDYDSDLRVKFLRKHIAEGCTDCVNANRMKNLEAVAASLGGPQALTDFQMGLDPSTPEQKHAVLLNAMSAGDIDHELLVWMRTVVDRTPWFKEDTQ